MESFDLLTVDCMNDSPQSQIADDISIDNAIPTAMQARISKDDMVRTDSHPVVN